MSGLAGRLRAALPVGLAARLPRLDWVDAIDSTSSALLRDAATLPDRALLLADAQTAGRGRRGRHWTMRPGDGLAMSLFARLPLPPAALGGLSLALGIACAQALRDGGAAMIGVKWPNDLVVDTRKLGGLLVEVARGAADGSDVVIGLGLNLRLPDDADPAWVALDALLPEPERVDWAARLAAALLRGVDEFARDGFAAVAGRWPAYDAWAGRMVRVLAADAVIDGELVGIDADGALRVRTDIGERRFSSADVSLRAP
jgi:BirA family biotin operon repressor/biotin-[acetyl-CoA-carboxylase] ligase